MQGSIKWIMAATLAVMALTSVGCSGSDGTEGKAAPVSSDAKAPPAVNGKKPMRGPALAGPNAGKAFGAGGDSAP